MTDHSFLTALSPIEYRPNDPDGRIAGIREMILTHEQSESPFKDCPMVHMARFQILDQLTPPMGDMSGKNLKTKYLMFVADIDGSVDDFLDCLFRVGSDFVAKTWGRCLGYPDYHGAVFLRRYIASCSFHKPLAYAGFPTSVQDNLRALTRKQALASWVRDHEGKSAAERQAAWRRDRHRFTNPDVPNPGSF